MLCPCSIFDESNVAVEQQSIRYFKMDPDKSAPWWRTVVDPLDSLEAQPVLGSPSHLLHLFCSQKFLIQRGS